MVRIISENKKAKYPQKEVTAKIKGDKIIIESESFKKDIQTDFNKSVTMPFGVVMFQKNPKFKLNPKSADVYRLQFMSGMNRARYYLTKLNVSLVQKEATVLRVSINDPIPDKSVDILNKLAVNYNREAILDKNSEAQKPPVLLMSVLTLSVKN
ncbi:hypothetical protein [Chryseobacterium indoltheticum]|uniref:hypothetical protein n=1 Tax=Chryseobacterium indoltheticum TaxID=254 RepID=UPI003F4939CB